MAGSLLVVFDVDPTNNLSVLLTAPELDPETRWIVGFSTWMNNSEERERLKMLLEFDGFEWWGDYLHYRSEGPEVVKTYRGSIAAGESTIVPRPPLLEIIEDVEQFLTDRAPFSKRYRWS